MVHPIGLPNHMLSQHLGIEHHMENIDNGITFPNMLSNHYRKYSDHDHLIPKIISSCQMMYL